MLRRFLDKLDRCLEDYWHRYQIYRQTPEGDVIPIRTVRGHKRAHHLMTIGNRALENERDWYSIAVYP